MSEIWSHVHAIENDVVRYRHDIHSNPELSLQEYETADYVESVLKSIDGIDVIRRVSPTGILAEINGRGSGEPHYIVLRSDMDALPGEEQACVPYRSKRPGVVHSCGHDMHTALLLGTARIVAKYKDRFAGMVRLFFQPAEEILKGAMQFIEAGALENPHIEAAIGIHVMVDLYAGTIGTKKGPMLASADKFAIHIEGRQCHAAHPHMGCDAIVIASHIVTALQTLSSRMTAPTDPVIVTVGQFNGGIAHNIVAGSVNMEGTIRAVNPTTRKKLHEAIEKLAISTASGMGGKATVNIEVGTPPLICDETLVNRLCSITTKLLGSDKLVIMPQPAMGGEDFAYITEKIPGLFLRLGIRKPGGAITPGHSVDFYADDSAIAPGLAVFAGTALETMGIEIQ